MTDAETIKKPEIESDEEMFANIDNLSPHDLDVFRATLFGNVDGLLKLIEAMKITGLTQVNKGDIEAVAKSWVNDQVYQKLFPTVGVVE